MDRLGGVEAKGLNVIFRMLTLSGGMLGAAGLSQFPEFTQQYTQRLAGAVGELSIVVEDFDRSASNAGLSRDEALETLTGTEFLINRRQDMTRSFTRFENLSADLVILRDAGPFGRLMNFPRLRDGDVAVAAYSDYKPALPLTFEGASFAAIGFVASWFAFGGIFAIFGRLFRRKSKPQKNSAKVREFPDIRP